MYVACMGTFLGWESNVCGSYFTLSHRSKIISNCAMTIALKSIDPMTKDIQLAGVHFYLGSLVFVVYFLCCHMSKAKKGCYDNWLKLIGQMTISLNCQGMCHF